MRKITAYVSGMTLLFFVFAAQASSPALTDAQIRGFIASMPDIQALGDKYPDIEDDEDDDVNFANPISSGIAKLRGHEAYAPLTRLVKQHGFSSPEQWGLVGDRVIRAFLATTMDETPASTRAQMAEILKQVDENPALSAEQKADMKKMMSDGMSFMHSLDEVPAADIKAIRPHLAELQRVMHVNVDDD